MRIRIRHATRYHYPRSTALGPHWVRLRPAVHARADVLSYNLGIEPTPAVRWQQDPSGNRVARLTFEKELRTDSLELVVDLALDVRPVNPFDFFVDDRCERVPFDYPDGLETELQHYLGGPKPGPRVAAFLERAPGSGYVTDWLVALNSEVAKTVRYVIRNEPGIQTSEETLQIGSGSCRDSALLLVELLRARGLAARFVSGYLVQLADEGIVPNEAKGVERDVVDLHAWAEVYVPGAGWIGLDGTSGLLCGEGHVPLACTVTHAHAAPVTGTSEAASTGFDHEMSVVRLGHEPRPRVPYTDEQWVAMTALGARVDAGLVADGVALTVGGEPTWTSRAHPSEPEWNTEALGKTKDEQGLVFGREIAKRIPPGSLVIHRFGKQYPGESLPRWAIHLLWRTDGEPMWKHPDLLGWSAEDGDPIRDRDLALELAARLAIDVGTRLGLQLEEPVAAFEDPWPAILAEQNLPVDVDPYEADLNDSEERRRLARVLDDGLLRPTGFAIPLGRLDGRWITTRWDVRRDRAHLVPGDSPMGLRLPLDRLAGEPPEVDPVEDVTTIEGPTPHIVGVPVRGTERDDPPGPTGIVEQTPALEEDSPAKRGALRTALCIEPRQNRLHVFLPPVASASSFLELVSAIEAGAAALKVPVRLEGYPPPSDPRIDSYLVTPDPGVIEVNLPVCRSFAEYVENIERVSDAANHAGLTTEKYQLDGRQAGSGGGNHITLGGPSVKESPFLNRPRLLAGLLRYVNHHPSLSYLFTGLFVGPTSQAPRIDEARHDAVHELELALAQVPTSDQPPAPWRIDRLLRNLLADSSGNTHRTEICIDKLYDPAGPAGRQGLVELRAFEMPPHERMAAAQVLLVRAVVARLARRPFDATLARWGTELHDRFMLPYFLWRDLEDVAADLRSTGIDLDAEWFRPFLDFRCPRLGVLEVDDVALELRTALEPWPTLGEEPAGPVVARYVDSSLERIEVRARGLVEGRHVVTVNGVELPLHATATVGERIAGVRFRAWQPPRCLQPRIKVHHPLRFDVVDTWAERSLGACTHHVWHPEGRAYEEPPLTAFEAAARRSSRFTTEGHAPWPAKMRPAVRRPEHPLTLDLRWCSVRDGERRTSR